MATSKKALLDLVAALTLAGDHAFLGVRAIYDFSLMLSAILREQGIPARSRCGFGAYFKAAKFEDHWVCRVLERGTGALDIIIMDAQIDALQRKASSPTLICSMVPRDRFILAGDAWQLCRADRVEPHRFGLSSIPGLNGLRFIAGSVPRDLASPNLTAKAGQSMGRLARVGQRTRIERANPRQCLRNWTNVVRRALFVGQCDIVQKHRCSDSRSCFSATG